MSLALLRLAVTTRIHIVHIIDPIWQIKHSHSAFTTAERKKKTETQKIRIKVSSARRAIKLHQSVAHVLIDIKHTEKKTMHHTDFCEWTHAHTHTRACAYMHRDTRRRDRATSSNHDLANSQIFC